MAKSEQYGYSPVAGLLVSADGATLYGTTTYGGSADYGTVFAIGTDGSGFQTLRSFPAEGLVG